MLQVVPPADPEAVAVAFLRAQLTARGQSSTGVSTRVPNPRPASLVRVLLAGNRRTRPLDSHLLVFDCWAATAPAASDLARLVAGLIEAMPGETVAGSYVYEAELVGGPVNLPDPDSSSPRYSVTARLMLRGTVAA
jgi:hypothetical protein